MAFHFTYSSINEIGQRPNQEDSIYPELGVGGMNDGLFIVCDGMGGHEAGEIASGTVCKAISDYLSEHPDESLKAAIDMAYAELDKKVSGDGERRMGTTLACIRFHDDKAEVAHIGDSRVYQVRPAEKRVMFVTEDHSLVNELVKAGEITAEEAKSHPRKNVITRAMQPGPDHADAEFNEIDDIKDGDWFYICSDGMLERMDDSHIANILSMKCSDEKKRSMFVSVTAENRDNHSAHLIHIHSENGEKQGFIQKCRHFIKYKK